MKRVLITGAAGFLGSHLCDRFIKDGYHVIAMDNLITGRLKNIEHLFPLEQFEFYNHDVSKFIHIPGELDYILHFASPASPIDYLKIPIQTLKVGSLGTHNCLGLAKAKKATILVASTSEVYGDPLVHPQPEEYWGNVNPVGPRGVYDEAKRFQEAAPTYCGHAVAIPRFTSSSPDPRPAASAFLRQSMVKLGRQARLSFQFTHARTGFQPVPALSDRSSSADSSKRPIWGTADRAGPVRPRCL